MAKRGKSDSGGTGYRGTRADAGGDRAHRDPGGDGALVPRVLHVRHRVAGTARRARRAQAGAPPDPLLDVRAGPATRPPAHQVRQGGGRGHGKLPPPRRHRHLRRAGPHGPGLQPPPRPHRRARQLRRARARRGPAAMRYTECRLAPLAMEMLAGIDEDTIDFVPNYDGSTEEPVVLPARFPNLLVNGSQGIAVGMATNIPPHNLGEVIDAVVHVLENPEATPDDLMQFVKGPDFPTGAQILGRQGILDAYRTGKGSIKMRALAEVDESRGADAHRGHRHPLPDIDRGDRAEDRRARQRRGARRHLRRPERLGRQDAATGGHLEARRQRERGAQQPLQAHAAADELRR